MPVEHNLDRRQQHQQENCNLDTPGSRQQQEVDLAGRSPEVAGMDMAGTAARKLPSLVFVRAVYRRLGLDGMGVVHGEGMMGHLGHSHDRSPVGGLAGERVALAGVGEG